MTPRKFATICLLSFGVLATASLAMAQDEDPAKLKCYKAFSAEELDQRMIPFVKPNLARASFHRACINLMSGSGTADDVFIVMTHQDK